MIDLLQIVSSLGVGALLGLVIFWMYRQDRKATEKMWRESKKFTEDRLTKLLEDDQETRREHTKAVLEYTKAVTELTTLLVRMNGKSK